MCLAEMWRTQTGAKPEQTSEDAVLVLDRLLLAAEQVRLAACIAETDLCSRPVLFVLAQGVGEVVQ